MAERTTHIRLNCKKGADGICVHLEDGRIVVLAFQEGGRRGGVDVQALAPRSVLVDRVSHYAGDAGAEFRDVYDALRKWNDGDFSGSDRNRERLEVLGTKLDECLGFFTDAKDRDAQKPPAIVKRLIAWREEIAAAVRECNEASFCDTWDEMFESGDD